jgi:hypothetical protein
MTNIKKENPRSKVASTKLSKEEYEMFVSAAAEAGRTTSQFLREAITEKARGLKSSQSNFEAVETEIRFLRSKIEGIDKCTLATYFLTKKIIPKQE